MGNSTKSKLDSSIVCVSGTNDIEALLGAPLVEEATIAGVDVDVATVVAVVDVKVAGRGAGDGDGEKNDCDAARSEPRAESGDTYRINAPTFF